MKKHIQILLITLLILSCTVLFVYTLISPRLALFRSLYIERPVQAAGTITGFETRTEKVSGEQFRSLFPIVQFTTEDGVNRKFVSTVAARPSMKTGDQTEVLFNNKKAVIRQEYISARNALLIHLVLAVAAAAVIIAATLHAFFGKPKQNRKKKRRNPYKKYLWRS